MRVVFSTLVLCGAFLLVAGPGTIHAADGFDPSCNAPENWQEDMAIERLMEVGWPKWFEDCRPGMPPIWPESHGDPVPGEGQANAMRSEGLNAPDTSAPGTLWDQPVADPLNTATIFNNLLNFSGVGDTSNFRAADDFFLDPALLQAPGCQFEISQIRYSEHDLSMPNQSPASDYVLEIWNDGGGRPSGVTAADMAAGPFNADSSNFVGVSSFGTAVYELQWDFAPPLVLAPGTYWLSASFDAQGGLSGETTTPAYGVPSGAFGTSQCNTCVAWTVAAGGGGSTSLDFDIDGEVVCPAVGPMMVGGVAAGEFRAIAPAAVTSLHRTSKALWTGLGMTMLCGLAILWKRKRR